MPLCSPEFAWHQTTWVSVWAHFCAWHLLTPARPFIHHCSRALSLHLSLSSPRAYIHVKTSREAETRDTAQTLQALRRRLCSQMLPPPHSLHVLRRRWCSQMLAPPVRVLKHSMHLLRSRLCWQMLFPLQSVQKVEYSASDRSALVTPRLKQKPKMKLNKTSIDKHRCAGSVNLLRACARLGSSESSRLASHVRCIRSFCAHRDTKRTLPTFALAPKPLVRTDLGAPTFFADAALSAVLTPLARWSSGR